MEKTLRFTYHSAGTYHVFNPFRIVYDDASKSKRRLLDLHKELVRMHNRPDVFILDNRGFELEVKG